MAFQGFEGYDKTVDGEGRAAISQLLLQLEALAGGAGVRWPLPFYGMCNHFYLDYSSPPAMEGAAPAPRARKKRKGAAAAAAEPTASATQMDRLGNLFESLGAVDLRWLDTPSRTCLYHAGLMGGAVALFWPEGHEGVAAAAAALRVTEQGLRCAARAAGVRPEGACGRCRGVGGRCGRESEMQWSSRCIVPTTTPSSSVSELSPSHTSWRT